MMYLCFLLACTQLLSATASTDIASGAEEGKSEQYEAAAKEEGAGVVM